VDAAPERERAVAFALAGGERLGDRVERHDVDPVGLDHAQRRAGEVGVDAQVARRRHALARRLVGPQQRRGRTRAPREHERRERVRVGCVVVEVERLEEARRRVDRPGPGERPSERRAAVGNGHADAGLVLDGRQSAPGLRAARRGAWGAKGAADAARRARGARDVP
jgi:hypothetical protein